MGHYINKFVPLSDPSILLCYFFKTGYHFIVNRVGFEGFNRIGMYLFGRRARVVWMDDKDFLCWWFFYLFISSSILSNKDNFVIFSLSLIKYYFYEYFFDNILCFRKRLTCCGRVRVLFEIFLCVLSNEQWIIGWRKSQILFLELSTLNYIEGI